MQNSWISPFVHETLPSVSSDNIFITYMQNPTCILFHLLGENTSEPMLDMNNKVIMDTTRKYLNNAVVGQPYFARYEVRS